MPEPIVEEVGMGHLVNALAKALAEKLAPAEAMDAREAAAFCGVSRSTWYEWDSVGECPCPVVMGGAPRDRLADSPPIVKRWLRSELLAWLRAGAPCRARWEHIKGKHLAGQKDGD